MAAIPQPLLPTEFYESSQLLKLSSHIPLLGHFSRLLISFSLDHKRDLYLNSVGAKKELIPLIQLRNEYFKIDIIRNLITTATLVVGLVIGLFKTLAIAILSAIAIQTACVFYSIYQNQKTIQMIAKQGTEEIWIY